MIRINHNSLATLCCLSFLALTVGCDPTADSNKGSGKAGPAAKEEADIPAPPSGTIDMQPFESEGPKPGFTLDMGKGVSMEFIGLGKGSFMMGGSGTGIALHHAKIETPFFLGKFEVTQEQWNAVMGSPIGLKPNPKYPANRVNWPDAQAFLKKMNALYGKKNKKRFALPTETQWEYGCRAGGGTSGYSKIAGSLPIYDFAWFSGNADRDPHRVGEKKANKWGFHDTLGNVWEWCADDPKMPLSKKVKESGMHVVRGGGYNSPQSEVDPGSRMLRREIVNLRLDGMRLAAFDE